ncbi:RNA pseudouridine synthase [candidate division SR1 bacterium]|nr:RNA pseudouridine synthase [candidate division SR1 bacterium]
MHLTYYQDSNFYFFRKPAGMPSTFGKESSFLDHLIQHIDTNPIFQSLSAFFGTEKEFGLLNRLDNDTSGLLYFAKNPRAYREFKQLQRSFQLHKLYVAEVYGDITSFIANNQLAISYPIAHHRYNPDRMVVIQSPEDEKKTKGHIHHVSTSIIEFEFLPETRTSVLLIQITKGIRHQIRAHLASIGHPICGDKIYTKSGGHTYDNLQLFSVGLSN